MTTTRDLIATLRSTADELEKALASCPIELPELTDVTIDVGTDTPVSVFDASPDQVWGWAHGLGILRSRSIDQETGAVQFDVKVGDQVWQFAYFPDDASVQYAIAAPCPQKATPLGVQETQAITAVTDTQAIAPVPTELVA